MTSPSGLLFNYYPSYMLLKIMIDGDDNLRMRYIEAVNQHNSKILNDPKHIDAGFDIFVPREQVCEWNVGRNADHQINKVDHMIRCCASIVSPNGSYNTGFYTHPRSSIYKTPLRLANSTGIIDAGYRGHIIGMLDCLVQQHVLEQYDRILQICAPSLMPIFVEIVNYVEELGGETMRGGGGFGSTGR